MKQASQYYLRKKNEKDQLVQKWIMWRRRSIFNWILGF